MTVIPIETLRALIEHDPASGRLFWKHRPLDFFCNKKACDGWNTRYAGKEALACLTKEGRAHGKLLDTYQYRSRVMWALEKGAWPEVYIDHIDGCTSNDRISNLRPATEKTNMRNLKRSSNNSSGHTGVFWDSQKSKWAATIKVNRKNIHLGFSSDFEIACARRKAAEDEYGFHPNHGRHS